MKNILALILATTSFCAIGCGSGGVYGTPTNPTSPGSGSNSTGANVTVNVIGNSGSGAFTPNPVSVTTGQTVAFKNNDGTTHHMVADNGSWDTGNLAPGATTTPVMVTNESSLTFHCTIHPTMVGSINGASAPPPPTQNSSGGYDY